MIFHPEILALSLFASGLLLLATIALSREKLWARTLVFAFLVLLAFRYMAWRFLSTLPDAEFRLGSIYAWGFAILELASHASAFLTYAILLRTTDRRKEADKLESEARRGRYQPTVDVLIPTYNEDETVLERTIVCALAIDYPKKTVYVLDDGGREWLRRFCETRSVNYITRGDNAHAKAGNLNHGLDVSREKSNGELILVLDADFCARRDILYRTVGFFKDKRVGILQTPQTFFNPDPIQFNYRGVGSIPDEQRLLFNVLQPAKDAWNAATCCGTSSVTRRECLDAIGGVPTESVTEDMLLSYRLYEKGYVTRYLNERLSMGMAPEGIKEYLTQRSRWCLGALQQAFLYSGPLGRNGIPLINRLEYISTLLYWCGSLPFVLLGIMAPMIFGFTGLSVINADLESYIQYFLPLFVAQLIAVKWLTGVPSVPIVRDAPNLLTALATTPLVARTFLQPFGRRFVVTAKGGNRNLRRLNSGLLITILALFVLLLLSLSLTLDPDQRLLYGGESQRSLLLNLFWGFHGLLILGVASFLAIELPRRRTQERFVLREPGKVQAGGESRECRIEDLSLGGARVTLFNALDEDVRHVRLEIRDVGTLDADVVVQTDEMLRLRFIAPGVLRDTLIEKLYAGQSSTRAMISLEEAHELEIADAVLGRVLRQTH
jgi:cellulose synthase (UDP-forming)